MHPQPAALASLPAQTAAVFVQITNVMPTMIALIIRMKIPPYVKVGNHFPFIGVFDGMR